jgi:purine-cytosine permease-like protein
MNDVLNSQGYTQAAWLNRIPLGAWVLMVAVGIFGDALFGYNTHRGAKTPLFIALPLVVSAALFILADMDSPRHGVIRVNPQNLQSLSAALAVE